MDYSPPGSTVHGILQQEYWSALPHAPPGALPDPGMNPGFLHFRQILYLPSHVGSLDRGQIIYLRVLFVEERVGYS